MYAAIQYKPEATQEDALRDFVGVLTGSITNVSQLSNSVNIDNSFLTVAEPGGWTLWDDRLTEDGYAVLSAPISDDPSRFKYIRLEKYSTDRVIWVNYKDWDNTNHTGTIMPRIRYSSSPIVTDYNHRIFYNYNKTDSMSLITSSVNHVASNVIYNNIASRSGMSLTSERTRRSPWDTVENGYIPLVITSGYTLTYYSFVSSSSNDSYNRWFYMPEVRYNNTEYIYANNPVSYRNYCTGFLYTSSYMTPSMSTNSVVANEFDTSETVADENKNPVPMLLPFGCHYSQGGNLGGNISEKSNMFILSTKANIYKDNDVIEIDGTRYRIWVLSDTHQKFAIVER